MSVDWKSIQCPYVRKNEIYLLAEDEDEDLECDCLTRDKSLWKMIKNKDNKYLVVDEGFFKYEYRNMEQCRAEDSCFVIQTYNNNDPSMPTGRPVTLQVVFNGNNYVVCCSEEGNKKRVYPKLQEPPLPDIIKDSKHEAVFLLQRVQPSGSGQSVKYKLESAKWPQWYLSFDDSTEPAKLVLNEVDDKVVNERIIITMTSVTH